MNDFLTKEQKDLIDSMPVDDRVNLVRRFLWNNIEYPDKEMILNEVDKSSEYYEAFLKGAVAMFDFAQMRAANHFHHVDIEAYEAENNFLLDTMEDALMQISPDTMSKWKNIGKLVTKVNKLQDKINRLTK